MNKQFKRFIALGLTISLASVPTLSEVSKANEIGDIQDISLLSTEIDEAMQSVKVDQLSMDDFALTIMEQPDIVDLEVMEDLPEHQKTMREDAEDYLKDIKPELIDLNERSILVAEYMSLYNDYFVSEIENVQEKKSSEQEARQNIEAGLQEMNFIIEEENTKVNDTQKEIQGFLVNLEEDYKALEAGVAEAEEYVISREGEIAEQIEKIGEAYEIINRKKIDWGIAIAGIAITALGAAVVGLSLKTLTPTIGSVVFLSGLGIFLGGIFFGIIPGLTNEIQEIQTVTEELEGANLELANIEQIRIQSSALAETTDNVTTSFDNLTNELALLQSNTQTMTNVVKSEDLNNIKPQFEEASITWENTKTVSEVYQQLEENTSDSVEIDLDGIDTEEEYEGALKEAYDVDELIDISDLTDEELEELLRELMEEELEEAA